MCNFRSRYQQQLLWQSSEQTPSLENTSTGCLVRLDTHLGAAGRVNGCDSQVLSAPSLSHSQQHQHREDLPDDPSHRTRPRKHSWFLDFRAGTDLSLLLTLLMNNRRHKQIFLIPVHVQCSHYCETVYFWHTAQSPPSTTIILIVSPYRMSVFFQVVSLHFLKSSVHLSIEGKKNSKLEFCSKKGKNIKGDL